MKKELDFQSSKPAPSLQRAAEGAPLPGSSALPPGRTPSPLGFCLPRARRAPQHRQRRPRARHPTRWEAQALCWGRGAAGSGRDGAEQGWSPALPGEVSATAFSVPARTLNNKTKKKTNNGNKNRPRKSVGFKFRPWPSPFPEKLVPGRCGQRAGAGCSGKGGFDSSHPMAGRWERGWPRGTAAPAAEHGPGMPPVLRRRLGWRRTRGAKHQEGAAPAPGHLPGPHPSGTTAAPPPGSPARQPWRQ